MARRATHAESRLTVVDVAFRAGQYGTWTELEAWFWFAQEPGPLRFGLAIDGWVHVRIGDLIARDSDDPRQIRWWNNHGEKRLGGALLLVSDVLPLPPLDP